MHWLLVRLAVLQLGPAVLFMAWLTVMARLGNECTSLAVPLAFLLLLFVIQHVSSNCRFILCFAKAVRGFHSATSKTVTIYYEPELSRRWMFRLLLERVQTEIDRLANWFGRPLNRRVTLFLMAREDDVKKIYRRNWAGYAHPQVGVVVLADTLWLTAGLRHELAHLFAMPLNYQAPPLLSEGVAKYLEGTDEGCGVDHQARALFQENEVPLIRRLISRSYFFAAKNMAESYGLAGSFFGYLVRRFGKEKVIALYKRCDDYFFPLAFRRAFGMRIDEVDREWREELLRGRQLRWRCA